MEIPAGVYVGNPSARLRDFIWEQAEQGLEDGDAIMAWNTNIESGCDFQTLETSRRTSVDFDGEAREKNGRRSARFPTR